MTWAKWFETAEERSLHRGDPLTPAQEVCLLRRAIDECWYMARRYADGRSTFAASTYNQHTRNLLALGVALKSTGDGTLWARDGMGRQYDGLTDEQAAEGRAPEWLSPAEQRDYEALRERLARAEHERDALRARCAELVQQYIDEGFLRVALETDVRLLTRREAQARGWARRWKAYARQQRIHHHHVREARQWVRALIANCMYCNGAGWYRAPGDRCPGCAEARDAVASWGEDQDT